ncbi:MAG TPA: T9SS type A sorting domain-containing protein [Mariniphaga anaerophila]|uniref:T9SS type A sorting domain-containing protein n=1 Tax=Mariniphaga anaerophila TaxID=1484053 RepID=A0A831PJV5_9BACT|nr:T9SS type A sorting domain-containing protein [Mariniphaga anaerophila]
MKWMLISVLLFAFVGNAGAQEIEKGSTAQSENLINIAVDEVNRTFVAPPEQFSRLKSAKAPQSKIQVTYVNFPEEAKRAFSYAVSIWESLLVSPMPIHVEAHWEKMGSNVLAHGRPSLFYNNFSGAPLRNTYYPVALAEKLSGRELNGGNPDIICHFNSEFKWYFGTDGNTPSTHYDFVSSVLHEITHGLGFSGFLKDDGTRGFFNNANNLPSVYDYFIFNHQNQPISDRTLFQSPSYDLHKQLTSDNLKICQTDASFQQQKTIDWVFAPQVWNEGSSIYHLKGYEYGNNNSLMSPSAKRGEAIHNPGEVTLSILYEMGWKSVQFEFNELKDIEEAVAGLPLNVGVVSDADEDFSSVRVIYSTDNFASAKSAGLESSGTAYQFAGHLPLNYHTGNVHYYLEAKTSENRTFRYPSDAPVSTFSMRIGPDYYVPNLFHNPVKAVAGSASGIKLSAEATDNLGIKSVTVEYKINGKAQEPVVLPNLENDLFSGEIKFPAQLKENDRVEYKITAIDNSARGNKRSVPAMGFQRINIHSLYQPVAGYATRFDDAANDFILADFNISGVSGISGNVLHTQSPYPVSALQDEKYELVAQLKYPVIIQPGGQMSFDEIVLVEPADEGAYYDETQYWDYVVVEASKDGGLSWISITDRYDSGINDTWYAAFTRSFSNNSSTAMPHESMFVNRMVSLTKNTGLEAGDTVLFRFRLASDHSVNGWGWAIGNLDIQGLHTSSEELMAGGGFQVYPNPASNRLFVEWASQTDTTPVEIVVSDLFGKTIRRETGLDPFFSQKAEIDLSGISPGIYLVSVSDGNRIVSTSKIVKN